MCVTQEHRAQRAAAVIHADEAQSNIFVCTAHTGAGRFPKDRLNPISDAYFWEIDTDIFVPDK